MWELDCEESWVLKNWCFWTIVLEKTLESPLVCEEIQPVHTKGDQSWVFIGRTDVEAETPILWPPDAKSWLIGKDPDAGKDCGQEEKGMTEDEMVGWHHQLDGYQFGWILGVGDGQGGLVCCDSWGRKEKDTNERLNWIIIYDNIFMMPCAILSKCMFIIFWLIGGFYVIWEKWISKTLKVSQKNKYMNMHVFKFSLFTATALSLVFSGDDKLI